jgi:hypothetical protein
VFSELFWAFTMIIGVLSLSFFWSILTVIGFSLTSTNLYAYYLCRKEHEKKIKNAAILTQDFIEM